jgi:hypothetical protein
MGAMGLQALLAKRRDDAALEADWDRRLRETEAKRATEPVLSVTFLRNGQHTVLYEGRDVTRDVKKSDWRFRGQPGDTLHVVVFLARDETALGLPPEPGKDGIPVEWLRAIAPPGVRIVEEGQAEAL